MYSTLKTIQEKCINDLLYFERQQFLNDTRDVYPGNKADGYNHRTLTISLDTVLDIKVPKCRKGNRGLSYSVFQKYSRHTDRNLQHIKELYKSKNFYSFVCSLLNLSKLPSSLKSQLKNKYVSMYNDFIITIKKAPEIIKLDATHFGARRSPSRYVMYFVWGINSFGKKSCLYFHVSPGSENREGWERVVNHINSSIDITDTQVIVSDMHQSLKKLLKDNIPHKPLQNCMFHRLQSIIDKIDVLPGERNRIFSHYYHKVKRSSTRKELEGILQSFRNYNYKTRKNSNKIYEKNINKMLNQFYEDNFTFLDLKLNRKTIMQNMDIESINFDLKNYLRYNRRKTKEILEWKTMMFLDKKGYLNKDYI